MSFLAEIREEKAYFAEMETLQEEFEGMEQTLEELQTKKEQLSEDAMDFGSMDTGEIFDEAQKRMKTARWAFGLVNKLRKPEERATHRRKIITVMNRLRGLLGRLIKKLTVEVRDDQNSAGGDQGRSQRPSTPNQGHMRQPEQQRPGMRESHALRDHLESLSDEALDARIAKLQESIFSLDPNDPKMDLYIEESVEAVSVRVNRQQKTEES